MKKMALLLCVCASLFAKNPVAVMTTNQGIIEIELRSDLAPKAVENFVTHSKIHPPNNLLCVLSDTNGQLYIPLNIQLSEV